MLNAPDILVPIDFSPCSVNALRIAMGMAAPDGELTLLHVIDEHFVNEAVVASFGTTEDVTQRLRERAESSFETTLEGLEGGGVPMHHMVVVGVPFIEILKIERDLDLPMIVMGVRGASATPEEALFGSTAEKVLRGSRVPVLCVPF